MAEPKTIRAGESLKWYRPIPGDYLASDGYTLLYQFFNGSDAFTIEEDTTEGGSFLVEVALATTADYVPGKYDWDVYAVKSGEKWHLASGTCEVLDIEGKRDGRSHARKMLEALEAVLQDKATRDQSNLSIAGRSIGRFSPAELEEWRTHYRREVRQEERRAAIADGKSPNRARVRFG